MQKSSEQLSTWRKFFPTLCAVIEEEFLLHLLKQMKSAEGLSRQKCYHFMWSKLQQYSLLKELCRFDYILTQVQSSQLPHVLFKTRQPVYDIWQRVHRGKHCDNLGEKLRYISLAKVNGYLIIREVARRASAAKDLQT